MHRHKGKRIWTNASYYISEVWCYDAVSSAILALRYGEIDVLHVIGWMTRWNEAHVGRADQWQELAGASNLSLLGKWLGLVQRYHWEWAFSWWMERVFFDASDLVGCILERVGWSCSMARRKIIEERSKMAFEHRAIGSGVTEWHFTTLFWCVTWWWIHTSRQSFAWCRAKKDNLVSILRRNSSPIWHDSPCGLWVRESSRPYEAYKMTLRSEHRCKFLSHLSRWIGGLRTNMEWKNHSLTCGNKSPPLDFLCLCLEIKLQGYEQQPTKTNLV